jgi:putative transposase
MPWGLKRFQESGHSHFVTFSCYHRRPLLTADPAKRIFELALERVRRSFGLCVYGYVVMPEHVHLLLSEPERGMLADALKSLKQGVSRRLVAGDPSGGPLKPGVDLSGDFPQHFWQKRYYDFNVRNYRQFVEKLRYIHRNPVKRGLCQRPEDWEWSSFRQYATACEGRVEIECEWTARRRERAAGTLCPAVELPHSSQKRA